MIRTSLVFLTALVIATGCEDPPPAAGDAADPQADAATTDAMPDAASTSDASLEATCDPERTWHTPAERPIEPGDYCDDLKLCAADASVAAAIMAVAPGFVCGDEPACEDGQVYCVWYTPDDLSADEWSQLCAITVMDDPPPQITCSIYL